MSPQTITVNGLSVEHCPGPGPALLCVHGSHAGAWCWRNFLSFFAARGYDAYALSLRGHAPNPMLAELGRVSLSDYADDVLGVTRALGLSPVLIGHSLGGAVCQLVAARQPPRALVLAASAPLTGVRFRRPALGPRGGWFLLKSLPAMLRGRPLPPDRYLNVRVVLDKLPPTEREALYRRLGPESSQALLELMRGAHRVDLSEAGFPRLVISGSDDAVLVMPMQRELAASLGADLIELPGHGHAFMMEPGWEHCAERLAGWLAAQPLATAARAEASGA